MSGKPYLSFAEGERQKPYYQKDGHVIYQGDVLESLKLIKNSSVHLIVTSPPYNSNKAYGDENITISDRREYSDYLFWLWDVLRKLRDKLVPGGRLCLNINDQGRNPYYPLHAEVLKFFSDDEFWHLMGNIVWDKQMAPGTTAWGSFKSASAPSLRGSQEYIIVAGKLVPHRPDAKGKESGPWHWTNEFINLTEEIWRFRPANDSRHPAPFPSLLPHRCIKLYSFVGDTVLDPFCGTGTTLREAMLLGRKSIGIDAVPKYCEMSAAAVSQPTLLELEQFRKEEKND